jgi:hypothetical protein
MLKEFGEGGVWSGMTADLLSSPFLKDWKQ